MEHHLNYHLASFEAFRQRDVFNEAPGSTLAEKCLDLEKSLAKCCNAKSKLKALGSKSTLNRPSGSSTSKPTARRRPPTGSGKRTTSNARCPVVGDQNDGKSKVATMNSTADADVTYLYTVDSSSSGRIVPEIDLSQESELSVNIVMSVKSPLRKPAKVINARCQVVQDITKPTPADTDSTADGDVTYLYTVDSSASGRIVPEIDLSLELETTSSPLKNVTNGRKSSASKGRKRKLTGNVSPRKRSNSEFILRCQNCQMNFSSIVQGVTMFLAPCGHLFCKRCSRVGVDGTARCPCGKKIHVLRKTYR